MGGFGIWMPDWSTDGHQDPHREETSMYGPALGQTGSSTRQELMAWLRVLAIPIRSHYASDSKAVVVKANKLLEAARKQEQNATNPNHCLTKNPFGKPWGMQPDGDLWEQAWHAVLRRGAESQRIRKVKGHATEADVQDGTATRQDRDGNHKSDVNADRGVEVIHSPGLVKLAHWAANRHQGAGSNMEWCTQLSMWTKRS